MHRENNQIIKKKTTRQRERGRWRFQIVLFLPGIAPLKELTHTHTHIHTKNLLTG